MIACGLPTLAITSSIRCLRTRSRSARRREFERCTIRLAHGGATGRSGCAARKSDSCWSIWMNQSSSCSTVRQLAVGKAPITPHLQVSMTSSGPDTRNIGAEMSGRDKRSRNWAGTGTLASPSDIIVLTGMIRYQPKKANNRICRPTDLNAIVLNWGNSWMETGVKRFSFCALRPISQIERYGAGKILLRY